MKTASRQHYRTLPIFGSFIDEFATWLRYRGLSSSKVQQHLADLQRLAPWLLRRQKRPNDLSVDDINDAQRCYRLRVPSLAAVIVVLGEFLQASGRLKSRQPLRQVKPRDYGHYRQLPVFGAVVDDFAQWSLAVGLQSNRSAFNWIPCGGWCRGFNGGASDPWRPSRLTI